MKYDRDALVEKVANMLRMPRNLVSLKPTFRLRPITKPPVPAGVPKMPNAPLTPAQLAPKPTIKSVQPAFKGTQ